MRALLIGLALLLPGAALAEPIESRKIIAAITGDWNGDGATDLAMIVETEPSDPMDMHFFLGDAEHAFLRPAEIVHGQINGEWNGYDRPGYESSDTEPQLTALPNGSIRLRIPALPVGSERTDRTLVIAYRDDAFIVAGFAYEFENYLRENTAAGCQYNVLTGKGESNRMQQNGNVKKTPVAVAGKVIAFQDWNSGIGFSACGN